MTSESLVKQTRQGRISILNPVVITTPPLGHNLSCPSGLRSYIIHNELPNRKRTLIDKRAGFLPHGRWKAQQKEPHRVKLLRPKMRCHNPPLGRNWTVLCLLLSVLQQIWTSCCYSNSAGCPCFPREHVCESSKLVVVTWQRLQSRQGLRERPLRLKSLPLSQWHKLGQKIPPQTRLGHAKLTRSLASRTLSHRGVVPFSMVLMK